MIDFDSMYSLIGQQSNLKLAYKIIHRTIINMRFDFSKYDQNFSKIERNAWNNQYLFHCCRIVKRKLFWGNSFIDFNFYNCIEITSNFSHSGKCKSRVKLFLWYFDWTIVCVCMWLIVNWKTRDSVLANKSSLNVKSRFRIIDLSANLRHLAM